MILITKLNTNLACKMFDIHWVPVFTNISKYVMSNISRAKFVLCFVIKIMMLPMFC